MGGEGDLLERANLCSFLAEDCRIYSGTTRGNCRVVVVVVSQIRQTVKGCRDKKKRLLLSFR